MTKFLSFFATLSEQQQILCQLLRGEKNLLDNQSSKLHQIAIENEIDTAIIQLNLSKHGANSILGNWQTVFEQTNYRISNYLTELDSIAEIFYNIGIQLVVLKNGGIARGIYPYPGACPMGDLDTLVEKRHFQLAHQILIERGYHFKFRSSLEATELQASEENGGSEYWKILSNGEKLWLELQWRPVAGRWIRPDQEPSAEELMARSIPIEGSHVRLLAPEDNLLQVALHTAKHTYVRAPGFRLHLDVERIVCAYPALDWTVFLERVNLLQVKTAVYFSLVIPKELFGTPIPDAVLAALQPARWKETLLRHWIQKAGLFNPHEKKFSRTKYILFTALLYDDIRGLLRGIFPDQQWMQEHYQFRSWLLLPYYHSRRLGNLLFRRLAT